MKTLRWLGLLGWLAAALATAADRLIYIGTYTGKGSDGIYSAQFDPTTGQLTHVKLAAATPSPSFLAVHPNGKYLYAVNEAGAGSVTSFSIDRATAKLAQIDQAPSRGADPCHLVVDPTGKTLIVANYTGGSVSAFLLGDDGKLGSVATFLQHRGTSVNKDRQEAAHAHEAVLSRDNRFAIICDLGMDKLMVYRLDPATAKLTPNNPAFATIRPGSGPRHFVFDAAGKHGYLINEMAGTIDAFDWDAARGVLTEIQSVSTLPENFKGQNTTAEIVIHPSGRFLYGSNRGDNSLALFTVNGRTGMLKSAGRFPTGGKEPRNFAIDPTGKWLLAANQNTDEIVVFQIDQKNGALRPAQRKIHVSQPVCVLFL